MDRRVRCYGCSLLFRGVDKTRELLERLNELNFAAPYVWFFWQADQMFLRHGYACRVP